MRRHKVNDMRMGKFDVNLKGQNIKSTVYFNPDDGYYIMVKGEKKLIKRISNKKYEVTVNA